MGYVKDTLQSLIREIVESDDLDLEVDPCIVRSPVYHPVAESLTLYSDLPRSSGH